MTPEPHGIPQIVGAIAVDAPQSAKIKLKKRPGLVEVHQVQQENSYYVIKDPHSGRFFRFRKAEKFILDRLDGEHSLDDIRNEFNIHFDCSLPHEELAAFIRRIRTAGLLEGAPPTRASVPRRSLLYLRFKAFDPDRILNWLAPRSRFLFTKTFLVISGALVMLATGLMLANTREIAFETPRLVGAASLVLLWLTAFVIGWIHEFAHGLACKRYGGEVREMGFMLIFLIFPAFYCNVSDSWLFEKRQRLVVLASGIFVELLLWALAVLAWRVSAPETVIHLLALITMGFCGAYTFFNLMPLIKLDGYYLLSDYLDMPNLRGKSIRYVADRIHELLGKHPLPDTLLTPRERKVLLNYGLLSGLFTVLLLSFIALLFGGYLMDEFQGVGFVLFALILVMILKNPLSRVLCKLTGSRANGGNAMKSVSHPIRWALLSAVAAFAFLWQVELKVAGEFTVYPVHNADVRARVDGLIDEIYVSEGETVARGQLLARLADREFLAELDTVEAEIAEKRANMDLLKAGVREEEIALIRSEVETARTRLDYASKRYDESRRMLAERTAKAEAAVDRKREEYEYANNYLVMQQKVFRKNLVSRLALDKAAADLGIKQNELRESRALLNEIRADDAAEVRMDLAVAEKQLSESENRLRLMLAGVRPEEIAATQAMLTRLEARKAYIIEQIRLTEVRSPITGVVTTPKLEEKLGQQVSSGDLVAEVYDLDSVIVEISVPEKEISYVHLGMPVILKARAFSEDSFAGKVVAIAPAVDRHHEDRTPLVNSVRVSTLIDNPSRKLKPGMTGMAKVLTGQHSLLDVASRRLKGYLRVEFWSWW